MLSRKAAFSGYMLGLFVWLVTSTSAPAIGNSNKSLEGNSQAKILTDGDTPLGPSGPRGPHGPLMIMDDGETSPSIRIGGGRLASPNTIKNARSETGELLTSGPRSADERGKGAVFFAHPTQLFQTPLETTVRAIKNDSVTVETPTGEHSVRLPPGRLAAAGITVGTKLTITADGNGATVHLRPLSVRPTPYAGIYVGAVQSAGQKYVTLRLRGGAVQTFSANPVLSRITGSLRGKTIALQSTDGRSVRTVLTAQQLNNVLESIPKTRNHYIGRIVNTTKSSVTLDLRDGSSRTFDCSKCADHKISSVSLVRGSVVYALTDPNAHVMNVVPVPDGTRIVGQLTSANPNSLSIMLASGDVATLPCACATILAGLGDIGPGQPIIADLDQNASITSLMRYPDDGRITGKLVNVKANRVSLVLPSGMVKSFTCNCLADAIAKFAKSGGGKMVSATLNPDAEVVSITSGSTPVIESSPPTARSSRLPCRLPNNKQTPPIYQRKSGDGFPCDNRGLKAKAIGELRPPGLSMQPPIAGCTNSDSAGIFIALRHWRSQMPVLGASVNLSGAANITLVSPPSGYLELLNVPSGTYRVTVQKAGLRKLETAAFRVNCDEGVRVQAYLRNAPYRFRIVRIQKRQFVFRVVNRQKAPVNCFYGSAPPIDSTRALEKTFVVKTTRGYYFCGVKKVTAWKKRSVTAPRR